MNASGIMIGIAGIFLGIVGIVVAFWLTREKRPLYVIRSTAFQGVMNPDLSIRFQGSKIADIYSIRYILWNAGGKVLLKEDIPSPQAGPRLKFSEATKILFSKAVTTSGDNSGQLVPNDTHELALQFDHLSKGDAMLGEVLCTTSDQMQPNANLSGHFKGAIIKKGDCNNYSLVETIFYSITVLLLFALAAGFGYMAFQAFMLVKMVPAGLLALFGVFCLWLTLLDIRANILCISNKLPEKYRHFLEYGIVP